MEMSLKEMLEHVSKYNGMKFKNLEKSNKPDEHSKAYGKVVGLLEKFGFKLVGFNNWYGSTYKLELEDYNFIKVRLHYRENPGFHRGTVTYEGILQVEEGRPAINPKTGEPWRVGDVDSSNPNYTLVLTANGWWSGD